MNRYKAVDTAIEIAKNAVGSGTLQAITEETSEDVAAFIGKLADALAEIPYENTANDKQPQEYDGYRRTQEEYSDPYNPYN